MKEIPLHPKTIRLHGQRFNRWTVIKPVKNIDRHVYWLCQCDCGTQRVVAGNNLRSGKSGSCGCLMREIARKVNTSHGKTDTPEHKIWCDIHYRCNNSNCHNYHRYGGRGIKVDPSWGDFNAFYSDMGPRPTPGHTIERLDNNGDYSPTNCVWATRKEQANNTSTNHLITIHGQTKTRAQWCEHFGKSPQTVATRINVLNWDPVKALTT